MTAPLPISFLSDYGYEDDFVGVCHGVIQRIAPGVQVIDITHGLPRHEIRAGAIVLRNTLPFMPPGVHLAIVDPGVGGPRRALALRCADGRLLVGPDNGLLQPAAERFGGVELAVDLDSSPFLLEPVSATFHGRDVFAPVAAALAVGTRPEETGRSFPSEELVQMTTLPTAVVGDGEVTAHAVYLDRFGNVQLNLDREQMAAAALEPGDRLVIEAAGRRHHATFARTFSDVPPEELLVYEDSYGAMAIAANRDSAARRLGVTLDSLLHLRRGPRVTG
jgi:S-adenosyl-L-methionine hydrolase (adenosine-forming)